VEETNEIPIPKRKKKRKRKKKAIRLGKRMELIQSQIWNQNKKNNSKAKSKTTPFYSHHAHITQ
jgi:hypothetical protein